MRNLILSFFILFNLNISFGQCVGYPCDTLWYDENGRLKDEFVAKEVRFNLGKCELQTFESGLSDSTFIVQMYRNLDSLANAIIKDGGKFEIQKHNDCRGSKSAGYTTHFCRAKTVCEYLIPK